MLKIEKKFTGKTVSNESGDSNEFLQRVLVEVAAENYRQLMYERIFLTSGGGEATGLLDPPLRANERIVSGLFANAISKTAARSRTEARVDRDEIDDTTEQLEREGSDDNSDGVRNKSGSVDFLAWYGQRTFAIELKHANMNCQTPKLTATIDRRWKKVVKQAQEAQTCLRQRNKDDPARYPHPVSLSVMVVIGRRAVRDDGVKDLNDKIGGSETAFLDALDKLRPKPTFEALYIFPEEFRRLARRKKGKPVAGNDIMYTPYVAFLGYAAVNSKRTK